ncbi:MAG: adenylate/guanylate cyclase domain-containing protein, partial [Acidimicrobiia bacterium]
MVIASGAGSSELRLVTVLVADVVSYTSLSEELGPERTGALLEQIWARVSRVLERYEASVEGYGGDEIVLRFGAPVAHEDDPARACHTALEIHAEVAELDRERRSAGGRPIRFRIGINTGRVLAAEMGAVQRREYGITGEAVNIAARLSAAAPPAGTLVGEATWRLSRGHFAFSPPRSLRLKGVSQPVAARQLLARASESRRRLERPTQLIGRTDELATLRGFLAQVQAGEGEVVALLGEAGIGKS